jgi:hypothetical protein
MRFPVAAAVCMLALVSFTAGGGAQTAEPPCHGNRQPKIVAELLFGRDIGHRVGVSETQWMRFLARELTPRFPDGLTVTDAVGHWRDGAGSGIAGEPSKHVEIVLPGNADDEAQLDAVVAAYKRAFRQHSVGVIVRTACVSF